MAGPAPAGRTRSKGSRTGMNPTSREALISALPSDILETQDFEVSDSAPIFDRCSNAHSGT